MITYRNTCKIIKDVINDDFTKGLLTCGSPDEVLCFSLDKYSRKTTRKS